MGALFDQAFGRPKTAFSCKISAHYMFIGQADVVPF